MAAWRPFPTSSSPRRIYGHLYRKSRDRLRDPNPSPDHTAVCYLEPLGRHCSRDLSKVEFLGIESKVFGAICMGKNVRFYRLFPAQNDESATVEEMDAECICIDRQP
ncbi:hypothetical protein V2G26_019040 [Clonostachys chloroleuca]